MKNKMPQRTRHEIERQAIDFIKNCYNIQFLKNKLNDKKGFFLKYWNDEIDYIEKGLIKPPEGYDTKGKKILVSYEFGAEYIGFCFQDKTPGVAYENEKGIWFTMKEFERIDNDFMLFERLLPEIYFVDEVSRWGIKSDDIELYNDFLNTLKNEKWWNK